MSWLSDICANRFTETYVKGFLDISGGDLVLRNGNIDVSGSIDISNNVSIQGDVSLNNNLTIDGNLQVLDVSNVSTLNTTIEDATPTISVTGDLSLNGNINLSGVVRTSTFFDVNSGSLPYITVDWSQLSTGSANLSGSQSDIRTSVEDYSKIFTNINSSQFQVIKATNREMIGFRVYPGLWEGTVYIKPNGGSDSNIGDWQTYLYVDTTGNGTVDTAYLLSRMLFSSTKTTVQTGSGVFTFYVPDGSAANLQIWSVGQPYNVINNNTTQSNNSYPYIQFNCLHVGKWNGTNSNMTYSGYPDYTPSEISNDDLDIQFSPGAAQFSPTS